MIRLDVDQACPVSTSYRAARIRSLFNVTDEQAARFTLTAELPLDQDNWQVGMIIGPSGSGKTSLGRRAWGAGALHQGFAWGGAPIVEEIAPDRPVDDVTAALSAVGLGSVPSWLRPFHVLSNGEKFRAELARLLLSPLNRVAVDEFTSPVDRQVARIGAAAFAKAWRRVPGRQVLLLSCHRDVLEWTQPDWYFDTEDRTLHWGCLQRPPLKIDVVETNWRPWKTFEEHHYLKLPNMIGATCYVALHQGQPVAHVGVGTNTGLKSARMCRLVVMPEWQGAGVGLRFMGEIAQRWLDGRNRYGIRVTTLFHTSHPGLVAALLRRKDWLYTGGRLFGESGLKSEASLEKSSPGRCGRYGGHLRAVQAFRYVGAAGEGVSC